MMEAREERGIELAKTRTIRHTGAGWIVPSQVGNGTYVVNLKTEPPTCSCPDYEIRGMKCKHIYAVAYVTTRKENADGTTTVTERLTVTKQTTTYPQNWPAYNAAQTNEKDKFQALLHDLCGAIPEPHVCKPGRPSLPLADAIFSTTFKVYSTVSGRRFMSDLRDSHTRGFISRVPHYNSIFNYLENPELTPILKALIVQASLPLKAVEVDFAVDSSGFSTSRFVRWFDHKYGQVREQHDWVKCHLMCGVKTNIVTAVEIIGRHTADTYMLPPMLETTAQNFKVSEVSADKGYSSARNLETIAAMGAMPYVAFTANARGRKNGMWNHMYHYFMFKRDEFLQHYHKRSNVESTFSMMKRKFGDGLRSKTDVAMVNETLCKVLCHNLVVVIHEMYELGIEPSFWAETALAQQSVN